MSLVSSVFRFLDQYPRRLLALVALICLGMLAFGVYLQLVVGLVPCPMCIVQRYALILIMLVAGVAALLRSRGSYLAGLGLIGLLSGFGAFVAIRQSFLQWFPPEFASCGRDFYGMIESFPLKRVIPMIFAGSGDCSAVDWTFLGLSIANWAFLWFSGVFLLVATLMWRRRRAVL